MHAAPTALLIVLLLAFSKTSPHATLAAEGRRARRWSGAEGLFFDTVANDSAWIRETGVVRLPPFDQPLAIRIRGSFLPSPAGARGTPDFPGLSIQLPGSHGALRLDPACGSGPWEIVVNLPQGTAACPSEIHLHLTGVAWTNALAWLGRITRLTFLQKYRAQNKNRQLRIARMETADGELIMDFGNRQSWFAPEFIRKRLRLGVNIVGFLTADLGLAEGARCMVRAADAASLPSALVDLRLPCKNRRGDMTYAPRLVADPIHPVNIVHIDPPASRDLEHHHGREFRSGRYNIGYWAWELPEFPDVWTDAFDSFDEIWCPSEFARSAIGFKAPIPVIAMPHAISFDRPTAPAAELRRRFHLPGDRFLFLFVYDLNSYTERKNPKAVIEAFRRSGLQHEECCLVLKVHNPAGNEQDLAALREAVADLPGIHIIPETLSRADIYALQSACDCFVSLHRSEGFGLAVAECMYLGKPVIVTDWSATTEFVDETTGFPVRAVPVTLAQNHGPYAKGQVWAEPDVEHAAAHMRRVRHDAGLRARIGEAACRRIEALFSPEAVGTRYRRRLETIAMR